MSHLSTHLTTRWSLELLCLVAGLGGVAGCEPSVPEAEATRASLIASDGFRIRGAVAVESEHVITVLDVASQGKTVNLKSLASGASLLGSVKKRDEGLGVVLVHVLNAGLEAPSLGDSGALEQGLELAALTLGDKGAPTMVLGTVTGWRAHNGRAYLETDLRLPESSVGMGVFGANASLVGLFAFSLTEKLNYVLPIEYVTAEATGLAGKVVVRAPSEKFLAQHQQAAAKQRPLEKPFDRETMECEASYSSTALLGAVTMLGDPQSPAHLQPVKFKLETAGDEDKRRLVEQGVLEQRFVQWQGDPTGGQDLAVELRDGFGDAYVRDNFESFEYGTLRVRVPLAPLCPKITKGDGHLLTLTLSDGRATKPIDFDYLYDVCAGHEEGHGDDWERDWSMLPDRQEKAAMARLRKNVKARRPVKPQRKGKKRQKKKSRKRDRGRR